MIKIKLVQKLMEKNSGHKNTFKIYRRKLCRYCNFDSSGKFAQETADFIVQSNIKYIWNFSPTVLDVPEDVQVWNENLMGNFPTIYISNINVIIQYF